MKSLDDLELEHESGGIDEESYTQLHDDYTARAAGVIRTLRDGVDDAAPSAQDLAARRVARCGSRRSPRSWCSRSSPACRSPTRSARASGPDRIGQHVVDRAVKLADRRGETSRSRHQPSPEGSERRAQRLRPAPAARRRVREQQRPPDRDQAVGCRHHHRSEPTRGAGQPRARPVPCVGAAAGQDGAAAGRGRSGRCVRQGHPERPELPDSYFYRAVVRAALQQYPGAQVDLQTYLVKAPSGDSGPTTLGRCSPRSRRRSKRLRLPCHRPRPHRSPSPRTSDAGVPDGAVPRLRDRQLQGLPRDHDHQSRHDRDGSRSQARAQLGEPLRGALAARASTTASPSTASFRGS